MIVKENLLKWIKYNHNIFRGERNSIDFSKLKVDLDSQSISDIQINLIDNEGYILDYKERQMRKSVKILIAEIEAI